MTYWLGFGVGVVWTLAMVWGWAICQANKERG